MRLDGKVHFRLEFDGDMNSRRGSANLQLYQLKQHLMAAEKAYKKVASEDMYVEVKSKVLSRDPDNIKVRFWGGHHARLQNGSESKGALDQ